MGEPCPRGSGAGMLHGGGGVALGESGVGGEEQVSSELGLSR